MGWFDTEKTVNVSSTVYNLAGDEDERPNFLKTTVIGAVLSNNGLGIGEQISQNYLKGPGIKLRSFARWSRISGYTTQIGQTPGRFTLGDSLDEGVLAERIPHEPDEVVLIQSAEIGIGDHAYWAERYMADNYPDEITSDWLANFNEVDNTIRIRRANGAYETFTPASPDYSHLFRYIFAQYLTQVPGYPGPVVTGAWVSLATGESFPPTNPGAGWAFVGSGASGDIATTIYRRTVYMGQHPTENRTYSRQETQVQEITSGTGARRYRIDTQDLFDDQVSSRKIFIYQRGGPDPVLNAMFAPTTNIGEFFPFIPVRLHDGFIREDYYLDLLEANKRAIRKSTGTRWQEIIDRISENERLEDIDFAYVVFGVSLNVKENACKRYIFEFFQEMMLGHTGSEGAYYDWSVAFEAAKDASETWKAWKLGQESNTDPLFGTPEPPKPVFPAPPNYVVTHASTGRPDINYYMAVEWAAVDEVGGTGLQPGRKVGELWIESGEADVYDWEIYGGQNDWESYSYYMDRTYIWWQETKTHWRRMEVFGLKHRNVVYGGKSIYISASEALADPHESGFIIPLHEGIFRLTPLVRSTQMATACCFVVFNSYTVVKQRWYSSSWFKVILIIVIIVVTIYTGGLGASAVGLLGTNATVGAALGATGAMATIIGAIANALAAVVLMQVLTAASKALFGEKVGAIVAVIAMVVASQAITGFSAGEGMSSIFGNMMRSDNILKLTMAAGDGYAGYMKASANETIAESQKVLAEINAKSQEMLALWDQNLSQRKAGEAFLDPLAVVGLSNEAGALGEPPSSFFGRTLMTGSDVAGMSTDMVTNFASMTTTTELPL